MNSTDSTKPKTRRVPKPFWFGVAGVLMVSLFLQVWLPYHREQVAIQEIERVGGFVNTNWDGLEDWGGPEWLRGIVKDGWLSWFNRAVIVDLDDTAISNEGLKHFSELDHIYHLNLGNTPISDEGLKHLSDLTNLTDLWLNYTQVSDRGLKHFIGLTNLEWLNLDGTQVSDEGLKHLSGLTNLSELWLWDTQVTDDGLKHLSGLTNLVYLDLSSTQVSDKGVKELQKALPNCKISH